MDTTNTSGASAPQVTLGTVQASIVGLTKVVSDEKVAHAQEIKDAQTLNTSLQAQLTASQQQTADKQAQLVDAQAQIPSQADYQMALDSIANIASILSKPV